MTDITLLDGGMGQELVRRAGGKATALWSTQALLDNPGLVAEVHAAYADAGSTMATTNTYALHRDRLKGGESNHYAGTGQALPNMEHQLESLLTAALNEAETIRDQSRVAGSIGPLAASYRPDLHPDHATAVPLYAEVAAVLAPRVDVLLFETIASVAAARAALEAGRQTDTAVWLSFTVDDKDGSKLRSGEPLAEAAAIARDADAALANCSLPEVMPAALNTLASTGVPTGAYGNAFQEISKAFIEGGATASEALKAREDMNPDVYAEHTMQWLDHGATILGGCCETGPAHIAAMAQRLRDAGHTLV